MNAAQQRIVAASGLDTSDLSLTAEGWSHLGYVAWQIETSDDSKHVATDDSRIAAVLRALDDAE